MAALYAVVIPKHALLLLFGFQLIYNKLPESVSEMFHPANLNDLSSEEIQDEYSKLFKRYLYLCEEKEADAQRIHELKRSLETATAAETYLNNELEQLAASSSSAENTLQSKIETKLEDFRTKYNELSAANSNLQQDYELLQSENAHLRKRLGEAASVSYLVTAESITEQLRKREQQLEQENLELIEKLEEIKETTVRHTMTVAEKERIIEVLQDQVKCLQENMRFKCEELEELTLLLESTQEQLMEANAKIAMLTATPGSNNHKGNSLFAEVDDQRQAMKQLLAAQKSSYQQMKKAFNESEHEIRRLKRENLAIHTELQACTAIFCSADKTYQEKLVERIRQLLNEKDDLDKKLKWTQDLIKEVASGKGVLWIDSMLNFCKQETAELKKNLHSVRIQKASLEEQLRNVEQEMSRWRFESLKSRCLLSCDKENALEENQINCNPTNEMCLSKGPLKSTQISAISSGNGDLSGSNNRHLSTRSFLNVVNVNKEELTIQNCATSKTEFGTESLNLKDSNTKENVFIADFNIPKTQDSDSDSQHQLKILELPKQVNISPLKAVSPKSEIHAKDISEHTFSNDGNKTKSILCKKMDNFRTETTKSVKFSTNEYNNPTSTNHVATVKQVSKKSNVIIRKVVLKSKRET